MRTLVVGAAIVDVIMKIECLPKSGEDILCSETKTVIGGCAYNVASTLNNLECAPQLCVPVGAGMYGSQIESKLQQEGYKILIKDEENDNGYCLSLVEADGERTFITVQGIEGCFRKEWFSDIDMTEYGNIYIAGYQVTGEGGKVIAEWAEKQKDKTIYFAPGPVVTSIDEGVMEKLFATHPVVHLNEKEAFDYTKRDTIEECAKKLYEKCKNLVLVTLGAEGTLCFDGQTVKIYPSEKTEVVDTIGAGDSHIAAFIGGRSKGMSVEESIKQANRIAARIVGIQGPTMNKKDFREKAGGSYE